MSGERERERERERDRQTDSERHRQRDTWQNVFSLSTKYWAYHVFYVTQFNFLSHSLLQSTRRVCSTPDVLHAIDAGHNVTSPGVSVQPEFLASSIRKHYQPETNLESSGPLSEYI